jgi:hypothetical protein
MKLRHSKNRQLAPCLVLGGVACLGAGVWEILVWFGCFDTGSHCVAQAGLELMILLP